jgi:hypothetical protein
MHTLNSHQDHGASFVAGKSSSGLMGSNNAFAADHATNESVQRHKIAVEALRTFRTLHFPQWINRLSTHNPLEGYLQIENCALDTLLNSILFDR